MQRNAPIGFGALGVAGFWLVCLCSAVAATGEAGRGCQPAEERSVMVELVTADMTLPHEARPEGVPDSFSWAVRPRVGMGSSVPAGWSAATMWGQLYPAEGGNPAVNTRVEVREPVLLYLSKRDGRWHELQRTVSVIGAAYRQDFAGDESVPADVRPESGGSVSVRLAPARNYHFWPEGGRALIERDDIAGMAAAYKARLVVDDPSKPDDRASARIIASCGGDYWRSLSAQWQPDWSNNGDWGIGRFRFVTKEWGVFTATTLTPDQIRSNPPPLYP